MSAWLDLSKCDTKIVSGPECDGHVGKFDSCVAEALYWCAMDSGQDAVTGSVEYTGHSDLFIVQSNEQITVDPDGVARTVEVPAGGYILFTASSGAVTLETYESETAARAEFDARERAYYLWDKGCDANNPDAHAQCEDYDECQDPSWVIA